MHEEHKPFEVIGGGSVDKKEKLFDPLVYSALHKLGFEINDKGSVIKLPKFIRYTAEPDKGTKAEVVQLLTGPEDLIAGSPVVVFKLDNKEMFPLPITSNWFEKWRSKGLK